VETAPRCGELPLQRSGLAQGGGLRRDLVAAGISNASQQREHDDALEKILAAMRRS
jgi:hypothetical protein